MLTKFDELTCHQSVASFDEVGTSDRAWTEKLWCNIHDTQGELVLATGLGVYPNRNVLDGYGCANVRNAKQTNLRLSRELRPRIDELSLGPLSYEVIEPFKKIRIAMGENEQGLSYDIEFLGGMLPGEEEPHLGRARGRVFVNHCRYAQLGRVRGWVKVGGERFELDPDRFYAQRDHSWGIRMGVGAPEQGVQMADVATFTSMMINWFTVQFPSWGLYAYLIEKGDGTVERLTGCLTKPMEEGGEVIPLVGFEHDWVYHENSPRMKAGKVTLKFKDGSEKSIEMRELTTMYLRGGSYLGYKDHYHGLWMGEDWRDGESWDLDTPAKADGVHGLNDTVVECKCDGEVGYGIVENLILPPYPRYGF